MIMIERAVDTVEIKVHDFWRWTATLGAISAKHQDAGQVYTAAQLDAIVTEWRILLGDEEE